MRVDTGQFGPAGTEVSSMLAYPGGTARILVNITNNKNSASLRLCVSALNELLYS